MINTLSWCMSYGCRIGDTNYGEDTDLLLAGRRWGQDKQLVIPLPVALQECILQGATSLRTVYGL